MCTMHVLGWGGLGASTYLAGVVFVSCGQLPAANFQMHCMGLDMSSTDCGSHAKTGETPNNLRALNNYLV